MLGPSTIGVSLPGCGCAIAGATQDADKIYWHFKDAKSRGKLPGWLWVRQLLHSKHGWKWIVAVSSFDSAVEG